MQSGFLACKAARTKIRSLRHTLLPWHFSAVGGLPYLIMWIQNGTGRQNPVPPSTRAPKNTTLLTRLIHLRTFMLSPSLSRFSRLFSHRGSRNVQTAAWFHSAIPGCLNFLLHADLPHIVDERVILTHLVVLQVCRNRYKFLLSCHRNHRHGLVDDRVGLL